MRMGSKLRWAVAATFLAAAAGTGIAAPEKTQNSAGIVTDYSAQAREFAVHEDAGREMRFVWNRETKFNGVVSNGARVTVRYTEQADGKNLAQTVGVLK